MGVVPSEEWSEEDKGKVERSLYNETFDTGFAGNYGADADIATSQFYVADEDSVYILSGTWNENYTILLGKKA